MIELLTFDFYYSFNFWFLFALIILLFRVLSFNLYLRNIFLLLSSILMLLALPRFSIFSLIFLAILSFIILFIGIILNKKNIALVKSKRIVLSTVSICFVILILSFFKYSVIQKIFHTHLLNQEFQPTDFIFIIGISYITFKLMHFIIESYKQTLTDINILNFLNYVFFFPSFISGPINQYNHFTQQLVTTESRNLKSDLKNGITRVIHGYFKKFVLCTLLQSHILLNINRPLTELSLVEIIIGLYATSLYFYFDFSAYSDIAIGSAKILGIELPENFNNPFLKKNLQQLWANWHISLTSWLTDYIYWPLTRSLRKRNYFKKHPILLSNISIIITFAVCGIWHGESVSFLIWGLYHGFGLAILKIYQTQKRKVKNDRIRKYFMSKYSLAIGIFVSFHFFVLGIIFFAFDLHQILKLVKTLFH